MYNNLNTTVIIILLLEFQLCFISEQPPTTLVVTQPTTPTGKRPHFYTVKQGSQLFPIINVPHQPFSACLSFVFDSYECYADCRLMLMGFFLVCIAKVDLAMLVDGSGSINYQNPQNFDRMKKFMKGISRRFNVAKDGTHIGIVLYSSNVQVVSPFEQHMTISSLEAVIDGMRYPGMGTLTGKGLNTVRTSLFGASARPGVPNVLLVITDGISQDDVLKPSASLRNMGVTIFSIGIGKNFNQKQLEDMATDPDTEHVFKADFKYLDTISDKIKDGVCQGKVIVRML